MRFSRGRLVLIASLGLLAGAIVLRLVADGGAGGGGSGGGGSGGDAVRHLLAWPDAPAIWDLRVARVLAAIATGTTLALGGVVLQTLLRNPSGDEQEREIDDQRNAAG
ncbi:MAG: iron chelate uptake ABC transporter family permease subunit, partial [Phycisphaerales bacterium]|nr:iron chelate uptake ABC transporter family permease subunit [Phycisphaerales bacterium]